MHEALFLKLLAQYESNGLSSSRIVGDPQFKAMPLEERVALLKKYADRIHDNSKVDKTFWSDVAMGSVGTAIAAYPMIRATAVGVAKGIEIGEAHSQGKPLPPLTLPKLGMADLSIATLGVGVATSPIKQSSDFLRHRSLVKKYLTGKYGPITTENAIDVIART